MNTNFPNQNTFASSLGQAVWLMSVSKEHRHLSIVDVEERITTAIVLQQFKIYLKDKKPIAFLSWASVSDDIKERFDKGEVMLELHEWRSGKNVVIVECVSPFAKKEEIEAQFLNRLLKNEKVN